MIQVEEFDFHRRAPEVPPMTSQDETMLPPGRPFTLSTLANPGGNPKIDLRTKCPKEMLPPSVRVPGSNMPRTRSNVKSALAGGRNGARNVELKQRRGALF